MMIWSWCTWKQKQQIIQDHDYFFMSNDPLLTMFWKTVEIELEIEQLIEKYIIPAKTKGEWNLTAHATKACKVGI